MAEDSQADYANVPRRRKRRWATPTQKILFLLVGLTMLGLLVERWLIHKLQEQLEVSLMSLCLCVIVLTWKLLFWQDHYFTTLCTDQFHVSQQIWMCMLCLTLPLHRDSFLLRGLVTGNVNKVQLPGSFIGPLLFTWTISPLTLQTVNVHFYADDTILYVTGSSNYLTIITPQSALDVFPLSGWSRACFKFWKHSKYPAYHHDPNLSGFWH